MKNKDAICRLGRIGSYAVVSLILLLALKLCAQSVRDLLVHPVQAELAMHWATLISGVALCALTSASLLFRTPPPGNFAIMAIATLIAAYLSEAAVWALNMDLTDRAGMHFNSLERAGTPVDRRMRIQVAADLQRLGTAAVPLVPPATFLQSDADNGGRIFPMSAISNAFTVHCNEDGRYETYTTDEHGFRNPRGLWAQHAPVALAIIGDSFTNGACVEEGADIASQIRREIPSTVNLGIDGSGPLIQLAIMKEYIPALRPRIVLWFYYENDLSDLATELQNPFLRRYLTPGFSQKLMDRQREVDTFIRRYVESRLTYLETHPPQWESALAKTLRVRRVRNLVLTFFKETPVPDQAVIDSYTDIVDEAGKFVAQSGGTLMLVYLPDWLRIKTRPDEMRYRQKGAVLAAAAKAGVPVIEVTDAFRSNPDAAAAYYEYPGSHYNKEGYRAAAAHVLSVISARAHQYARPVPTRER